MVPTGSGELSTGTLRAILRQLGLKPEGGSHACSAAAARLDEIETVLRAFGRRLRIASEPA
jgi:hypothetical protein